MPNETNDQLGDDGDSAGDSDQHMDGNSQGMGGQVSAQGTADGKPNAATAQPEDEPVGSTRPEPRPVRKMSASDFKVRSEPKPEPKPLTPEPSSKPIASSSAPAPEPVKAEPEPIVEPVCEPEPVREPVYEPVREPEPEPISAGAAADRPYNMSNEEPQRQEPPRQEQQKEPRKANVAGSGGFMDAVVGALSFFTILPIHVGDKEIQALNKNFYIVPYIGLFIGLIASIVGIVFYELKATVMAPIAILATFYIMSKFLHFDGLADFGDGMVSSGDRESRVRALKDVSIGAGGLGIALIVVLATYAGLDGINLIYFPLLPSMIIVIMEVFAKNTMVATAVFGEPGTGMASEQVRNSNFQTLLISTVISVCLAFAGYIVMGAIGIAVFHNGFLDSKPMITALLLIVGSVLSSIFVGWLVAYLSNKKFGFVNGDCLGAANEISRVMILFIAFIILGFYLFH